MFLNYFRSSSNRLIDTNNSFGVDDKLLPPNFEFGPDLQVSYLLKLLVRQVWNKNYKIKISISTIIRVR